LTVAALHATHGTHALLLTGTSENAPSTALGEYEEARVFEVLIELDAQVLCR